MQKDANVIYNFLFVFYLFEQVALDVTITSRTGKAESGMRYRLGCSSMLKC